jgi:hypothetical protein
MMKTITSLFAFWLIACTASAQNSALLTRFSWTLSEFSSPKMKSEYKGEDPSEERFTDTFTFSDQGTVKIQNEEGVVQGRWTLDDTGRKLVISTPEHVNSLNLTISSISEESLLATTLMEGKIVQLRFRANVKSAK